MNLPSRRRPQQREKADEKTDEVYEALKKLGLITDSAPWHHTVLWFGLGLAGAVGGFVALGWVQSGRIWPWGHSDAPELYDLSRSTVALVALIGSAIVISLSFRRQKATELAVTISARAMMKSAEAADAQGEAAKSQAKTAENQAKTAATQASAYDLSVQQNEAQRILDREARFSSAAEQLGHRSPSVQLAGLYALRSLIEAWLSDDVPQPASPGAAPASPGTPPEGGSDTAFHSPGASPTQQSAEDPDTSTTDPGDADAETPAMQTQARETKPRRTAADTSAQAEATGRQAVATSSPLPDADAAQGAPAEQPAPTSSPPDGAR